ncbi:unnamed protein product, partial [Heligmosomoides polygyrus]|uniref:RNase H domain-containing protein n=1 Tax=Heligmosomoides polygyrus TaxID=6339 RepID=A0A183GRI7_HELPZ
MNLRDYLSNSAYVNKTIPDSDRAASTDIKVLGIQWNAEGDTLSLKCVEKQSVKVSKRTVLSQINGYCFDPLGLLTPLLIPAKIFLQDLHKKNIYVTTTSCGNRKDSRLFTAKSKIAPISKEQTIPRLELLSIFIGLSLAESTIQRIDTKFEQINVFSDSTIALCWVQGNRRLPSIVSTLVQKIGAIAKRLRESTQVVFFHVPTNENVADCATRGVSKDDLAKH